MSQDQSDKRPQQNAPQGISQRQIVAKVLEGRTAEVTAVSFFRFIIECATEIRKI